MGVELVYFCYITSEGIEPTRRLDIFKKAGPFQTVGFRRKNFGKVKSWKVKTRIGSCFDFLNRKYSCLKGEFINSFRAILSFSAISKGLDGLIFNKDSKFVKK